MGREFGETAEHERASGLVGDERGRLRCAAEAAHRNPGSRRGLARGRSGGFHRRHGSAATTVPHPLSAPHPSRGDRGGDSPEGRAVVWRASSTVPRHRRRSDRPVVCPHRVTGAEGDLPGARLTRDHHGPAQGTRRAPRRPGVRTPHGAPRPARPHPSRISATLSAADDASSGRGRTARTAVAPSRKYRDRENWRNRTALPLGAGQAQHAVEDSVDLGRLEGDHPGTPGDARRRPGMPGDAR